MVAHGGAWWRIVAHLLGFALCLPWVGDGWDLVPGLSAERSLFACVSDGWLGGGGRLGEAVVAVVVEVLL